jgi:hypothetical protein
MRPRSKTVSGLAPVRTPSTSASPQVIFVQPSSPAPSIRPRTYSYTTTPGPRFLVMRTPPTSSSVVMPSLVPFPPRATSMGSNHVAITSGISGQQRVVHILQRPGVGPGQPHQQVLQVLQLPKPQTPK